MLANVKGDALIRNPSRQRNYKETNNQAEQANVRYGAEEKQSPRAIAEVVKTQGKC